MMHVEPAPEPTTFKDKVRVPGLQALAEMVGRSPSPPRTNGRPCDQRYRPVKQADGSTKRVPITRESDLPSSEFKPYWTEALDDLMTAYDDICAYSCLRIHRVTGARSVDHFAPRSRAWDRVYEWNNYRLACSRLNARKRDFTDVLDPFSVQTGWFRLELVGFQILPALNLDDELTRRIEVTLDERLGLNDKVFLDAREEAAEDYWSGKIVLQILQRESPFVAHDLHRQGKLLAAEV